MNNVLLTAEQAQQIEESLARISDKRNTHFAGDAQVVAGEALAIIQAARAQEPITTPDVCGEAGPVQQAEQEPIENNDWKKASYIRETLNAEQAEQEPLLWGDDKFAPHERPQNHEPVAWAISHSLGLEFGSKYPMQETKEAAEQMARQHMGAVVVTPLYAAPVRTKDLTPHEITALIREGAAGGGWQGFAQRVIAADRELNRA